MTMFRATIVAVLIVLFCADSIADSEQDSSKDQPIRGIDGGGGVQVFNVDLTATAPGSPDDSALKPAWVIQLCSALSDSRFYFYFCE